MSLVPPPPLHILFSLRFTVHKQLQYSLRGREVFCISVRKYEREEGHSRRRREKEIQKEES
jgi:hypothetical protein